MFGKSIKITANNHHHLFTLKNQNKYLPHFKCPFKNTTRNGRTILKTYAIDNVVVGGIIKDDDVMKKERMFFNPCCCYCKYTHCSEKVLSFEL